MLCSNYSFLIQQKKKKKTFLIASTFIYLFFITFNQIQNGSPGWDPNWSYNAYIYIYIYILNSPYFCIMDSFFLFFSFLLSRITDHYNRKVVKYQFNLAPAFNFLKKKKKPWYLYKWRWIIYLTRNMCLGFKKYS